MSNQAQTNTNISNNTTVATGWHTLNLASGFLADNIVILAFIGIIILLVGAFAIARGGGD